MTILTALGFAFLGGILLNLMPCVLPVLSIKVFQFLQIKNKAQLKKEGLTFTLGVLVSFWVLAILIFGIQVGGKTLGWGFQLQSPLFVSGLFLLFLFLGFYLLGFFEFNPSWVGLGSKLSSKEGFWGTFFTGVLTTIAATPCSAPFMGTALGVALGQPFWFGFLILTFLGLGLSFPYLVFSYVPYFSRFLPKPGAWMVTLKEFLAFPLFATCIWLLTVLFAQKGVVGITNLFIFIFSLGFAVWIINTQTSALLKAIYAAIIAAGITFFYMQIGLKDSRTVKWQSYDEITVQNYLSMNRPVFIDFTAEWCVTCHVNEELVLSTEKVLKKFEEKNVVLVRADWTNGNPAVTHELEKYKRNSIPFYLLFVPGEPKPFILPEILTPDIMIEYLEKIKT
jgi:thiol:disulfide interchange protein DsbD